MNTITSEQDFLRDKTRVVYESEREIIDRATGEILQSEKETSKRTSSEPDYIKIYYKAMMAVQGVEEIPLSFMLALSCEIGFSNGDRVMFYNNKTTRRRIAEYCAVGDNMVTKYIRRCVDKGVLFSTPDRGTYEVNPWLIAKGKWEHIKELQASFRFVAGKWERIARVKRDDESESEPEKMNPQASNQDQIDGQMSLFDYPGVTA